MNFPFDIFGEVSFSAEGMFSIIFFLAALFSAVVSVVLFFHWRKYGVSGGPAFALAEVVYLIGVAALITSAFIGLN